MPNKLLRILIADEDPVRLLQAERLLNKLGYYRIAPVRSFRELRTLTDCNNEPFDLLIAHSGLTADTGVDLINFCRKTLQIRNSLIYECTCFSPRAMPTVPRRPIYVSVSPVIDGPVMQAFMDIIDPAQDALFVMVENRTKQEVANANLAVEIPSVPVNSAMEKTG